MSTSITEYVILQSKCLELPVLMSEYYPAAPHGKNMSWPKQSSTVRQMSKSDQTGQNGWKDQNNIVAEI